MPTVLLSPSFGEGFNIKNCIKEEYLERIGLKAADHYTDEQKKCFIHYEFEKAILKNNVLSYGNMTSSDSKARVDSIIIDIYNECENITEFNSELVAIDIPDIFYNDWYITDYDNIETLNINIDRAFYKLSSSFMTGDIGLDHYKSMWIEYNKIKDAFVAKIKSDQLYGIVVINEDNPIVKDNDIILKHMNEQYKNSMMRATIKSIINKSYIELVINEIKHFGKKINRKNGEKIIADIMFNLFSGENITRISKYDPSKKYCIWKMGDVYILLYKEYINMYIDYFNRSDLNKAMDIIVSSFISFCHTNDCLDDLTMYTYQ
jgi:hypothetical protein